MKFDKEKIMQPKTVVHCSTDEQASQLLNWAASEKLHWGCGAPYTEITCWYKYKDVTCYNLYEGQYSYIADYRLDEYTILVFEDVVIKEEELNNKTYSFKGAVFKLIQLQELELQELHHRAAKTCLPVLEPKYYAERIDKPSEAYRFKLGRTKTNPLKEYNTNKDFLTAPDDVFAMWTIKTIKEPS